MQLRPASSLDIPAVLALIDSSVRTLCQSSYTPEQIDSALLHVFGVDSQLIDDGTYYVVEADDTIVAAGGWSARMNRYGGDQVKHGVDPLLNPSVDFARIRAFYVHPRWTRRGIARRIYSECETAARARGFSRFELTATLPGVALYEALGFTAREPVNVPLADGLVLPCIRMDKPIDPAGE